MKEIQQELRNLRRELHELYQDAVKNQKEIDELAAKVAEIQEEIRNAS